MVLEKLGGSLRDVLKKIANASHIDKELVKEVVRDIQKALLQADVNVKMVLELTKELERRALTERPPAGMSSREHVIKIIYDELVKILGKQREIELKRQTIMMVGLYGHGKTTTCGKLAKYFQKRGLKVALVAGDTHRPAAYDQLEQISKQVGVSFYGERGETRAPKIVRDGLIKFEGYEVVIVDTSGRHSLEQDLIEEIKRVSAVASPTETFLILDATTGQAAGTQAKAFHEAVGVTGVVITKLDGTAKGGGAISAVAETKSSVMFIGVGEHLEDMEKFEPPRFISRLLGMGDLQTLLEKAQEVVTEEEAEETARKLMSGRFTLKDMYDQMKLLSGMGPLKKLASMIPGFSGKLSDEEIEQTQQRLRKFKVIMDSMTKEELENPRVIKSSRVARIARGCGLEPKDIKDLLRQYNMSRRTIKGISGNRKMQKMLMKQFGSGSDFRLK
jgi:signal recognition particle subunit SRP54